MNEYYYSNAKLMISGEYLVLHGATSLVVPLKVGQHMQVSVAGSEAKIRWNAREMGKHWFFAEIDSDTWSIERTNDPIIAGNLLKWLRETAALNPSLFGRYFEIKTDMGFNRDWGFGSSATLTVNLAQWAQIDPFELHFRISEGSGADVAAALSDGPVLYRLINNKPHYRRVNFAPSFLNMLWLVYTGKKQDTQASIKQFKNSSTPTARDLKRLDEITLEMISCSHLREFAHLMAEHEKCLSGIRNIPSLKERFSDFAGELKSLGAWGGDFIMAASEQEEESIKEYFLKKNMQVLFSLDQIILQ